MAFPFFPESHPAMTVKNFTYMKQLQQHQRELREPTDNHQPFWTPKSPRPQTLSSPKSSSSEPRSLELLGPGQGKSRHLSKRRLARMLIPAKSPPANFSEGQAADMSPNGVSGVTSPKMSDHNNTPWDIPTEQSPHAITSFDDIDSDSQEPGIDMPSPSTLNASPQPCEEGTASPFHGSHGLPSPSQHPAAFDPNTTADIFRSCSRALTNPFSRNFELNPLLLNITHPLLSMPHHRERRLRVLDLGGNEDSVYSNTIATLPQAAVCRLTGTQLEAQGSAALPFPSKGFDVVSARTLYKFISNSHPPPTPEELCSRNDAIRSYVREIHRVLDRGGSFEYIFFDRQLSHAGPLTAQLETFLYEEDGPSPTLAAHKHVTGAQFLELLVNEGFTTERNTTLMFPFPLLSTIFTQDGQHIRESQRKLELDDPGGSPMLSSVMKAIYEECEVSQTSWRCIIGSAQKG